MRTLSVLKTSVHDVGSTFVSETQGRTDTALEA